MIRSSVDNVEVSTLTLLCAHKLWEQTLHKLADPLCQVASCLDRQLRPQAWRHSRQLRRAPRLPARGAVRRRLRDPHAWKAQHSPDVIRQGQERAH